MKVYIELRESTFVVEAESVHDAIGLFWRRQLKTIAEIPEADRTAERIKPFNLALRYAVHFGRIEELEVVKSANGIRILTMEETVLLAKCLMVQYGKESITQITKELDA